MKKTENTARVRKLYSKVNYEVLIFTLLIVQFITLELDFSKDVYSSVLVLDYRIGFLPRLFAGSVLSLFTDYKGKTQLNIFFFVIFLITFILVAWLAGQIIRNSINGTEKTVCFLVALFLSGPYSNSFLFPQLFSLDRFLVFFTILSLVIINKPVLRWFLPLIVFMALATHHSFTFAYMPLIAILLVYEYYRSGYSRVNAAFCILNFLVMAFFTLFFYLNEGTDSFSSLKELVNYTSGKTDIPIRNDMLEGYFFMGYTDFREALIQHKQININIILMCLGAMAFFIPLGIIFFFAWKYCIKGSSDKFGKLVFILCMISPLASLPLFIISTDYFRAIISIIIVQYFLILYFIYYKNPIVIQYIERTGRYFEKHTLLLLILIAYFALSFCTYTKGKIGLEFFSSQLSEISGTLP